MNMIQGLLGRVGDPSVSSGLLSMGASLLQAGGQGAPTGAAVGQGLQAFQQAQQMEMERQRQLRLREAQQRALAQLTDGDLQLLAQLDPSGQAVAQVVAARMRSQAGEGTPMNVKEWQYYSALPPDQQQQYLSMKRAAQFQDMGGYVAPVDPRTGSLNPGAGTPKTLPPEQLPAVKGAQAHAAEAAKAAVELDQADAKRARSGAESIALLDEAETILKNGATGSAAGATMDAAAAIFGHSTKGAQGAAALRTISGQLVAKMPRMEGPQSNYDVKLYTDMAGDLANPLLPVETRMAALQTIRRLNEKYAGGGESAPTRKRYNPATGKIEAY